MKFNFKKITSILASAVMLGSTIGIAAAANYPAPFIAGGVADVAVVVGTSAANSDFLAAVDLGSDLSTELSAQTASGTTTGTATASGGDSLKLEKSTNKLNINDDIKDVWTTKVTDANLPSVLQDGTYSSKDNIAYAYEQYIEFFQNLNFTHFDDDDYIEDTPSLGIRMASSAKVLNYTIDFKKYPRSDIASGRLEDLEDRDINIMGKTYKLLNAYNISSDTKFELMRGAASGTINLNEETTVSVDDKSYTITLTYIDATYTQFDVIDSAGNSQTTTKLAKGGTYKLKDGTQLGVTDISYQALAGGVMNAAFTIGANKLTIENGQTLEMDDVDVNGITGYITRSEVSANKVDIQKIVLQWSTNDEEFVADDAEVLLPGFQTLKLSSGGFTTGCEETVEVKSKSTYGIELTVPIKDGDAKFTILQGNATDFVYIGEETNWADGVLRTSNETGNQILYDDDTDDKFVASWNSSTEAESYLLRATSFTEDTSTKINYTTIENLVTGAQYSSQKIGDVVTMGNVELTIGTVNKAAKSVDISISAGGSFNRIYTKGGLGIWLPSNCTMGAAPVNGTDIGANWNCIINASSGAYNSALSWRLKMTEEDKNGNIGAGGIINVTLDQTSGEAQVTEITAEPGADAGGRWSAGSYKEVGTTNVYEGYVASDLGSKVLYNKPTSGQKSAKITYHCVESYGNIFLNAPETTVTSGTGGTATTLGSVTAKDTELTSTDKAKNLIVIGGSCINSVAAEILGGAYCTSEFTTNTGVGEGQFLIKVVTSPYASTKVAMLVAGYQAADTTNAVKYATTETLPTAVGTTLKKVTATYVDVA